MNGKISGASWPKWNTQDPEVVFECRLVCVCCVYVHLQCPAFLGSDLFQVSLFPKEFKFYLFYQQIGLC